ncbi:MAG: hypothetical protein JHC59_07355 [Ilumatobacteraceae bacterium]|nr:hypothetical protein [Ilumatobacteraceae bacterium]
MASTSSTGGRFMLPGGVASTRRSIKRRGGFMAIGCAVGLWLLGVVFSWIVSGPKGGSVAFVLMVMALPVMPILGMPAAGGAARLLLAVASSAVLWWFLGQVVAGRVTKRPVVGWREWLREFVVAGLGLWIGAAGGLLLGVLVLGAF